MYLQGMSTRSHKLRNVKRKAYFRRIPKTSVMSSHTPCLRNPAHSAFSNNRLNSFSYVSTHISRSGKARLDVTQIRLRWMRTRAIATRPKAPKMHETNCPTSGTVSRTFKTVAIFSMERVGSGGGGTILRSSVCSTIQPITSKPIEGESLAFLVIKLRINSDGQRWNGPELQNHQARHSDPRHDNHASRLPVRGDRQPVRLTYPYRVLGGPSLDILPASGLYASGSFIELEGLIPRPTLVSRFQSVPRGRRTIRFDRYTRATRYALRPPG